MIYFLRVVPYLKNPIANTVVGVLTIIYVIGGGSFVAHYIICASVEIILTVIIIFTAWKWVDIEKIKQKVT